MKGYYKMYSVLSQEPRKANKPSLFLGDSVTIARYDQQDYPWLEKLTRKQISFFWVPEEVDIYRDAKDFKALLPHEQHIFTSNLKRQILLDSIQGRAPMLAFGPICSVPELETWLTTWTFFETLHSRSYTYIIQNIYSNPSIVFDSIMDIKEIADCSTDISKYYDELINFNYASMANPKVARKEHKKAIWKAIVAANVLEGIRFYVSFAASWAFAENKKMEGNAKIIKFIGRDEVIHLAVTQQLLKTLVSEDSEFKEIAQETKDECTEMYRSAAEQEKTWIKYMFKDGSIIGLNERILNEYVEWLTDKRLTAVGYDRIYKSNANNPLPWTQKWISGAEVQVAPQEVAVFSYTVGAIKQDLTDDALKGMSL